MRDPKRIKEIFQLLEEYWQKDPDLRFNQMLYNLQWEYSQKNSGIGQIKEIAPDGFVRTGFDFFNLEDDEFINYLKSKVEK